MSREKQVSRFLERCNIAEAGKQQKQIDDAHLLCCQYEDWELGSDAVLRVGDYVELMHEEPSTGIQTFWFGRILREELRRDVEVPMIEVRCGKDDDETELWVLPQIALDNLFLTRITKDRYDEGIKETVA